MKYGSLGRKASHKREMLHKHAKNYLLIKKSVEISPCEIRYLLDYDRGQCADSSYLKVTGFPPMAPAQNRGPLEHI